MAAMSLELRELIMPYFPLLVSDDSPQNPNLISCDFSSMDSSEHSAIEVPEVLFPFEENSSGEKAVSQAEETAESSDNGRTISFMMRCEGGSVKKMKADLGSRIGFRMKSEVEVLDDGYKWRKYGKKSIKNTPNLRNYYRCTSEGCCVKKRVERDGEDPTYVITTYEGVHNHMIPGSAYNAHPYRPFTINASSSWASRDRQVPLMAPNAPASGVSTHSTKYKYLSL